ncbi:MAG: hypothetical protein HYZ21_02320 [Chloroflexi bacterium]|nr:hypothetical protein [Chloroflexota bacterium]
MAKVENNPIVRGISGKIGNLVFRPMPNGETYVSGVPNFDRRKFSEGQKDHQSRFKRAVAYAREAAKTQPIYARLAAGTIMSAYNFALSDWFNPPVIHKIERVYGRIRVQASDNVMVTKVLVTILDEEGKVVEKKEAWKVDPSTRSGTDWWEVDLVAEGKVLAEAWDLAGNVVKGVL